jgi:hypothetical protein
MHGSAEPVVATAHSHAVDRARNARFRSRIKELNFLTLKTVPKLSEKRSEIHPGSGLFSIPGPESGSGIQGKKKHCKNTGSRIRIRNADHSQGEELKRALCGVRR